MTPRSRRSPAGNQANARKSPPAIPDAASGPGERIASGRILRGCQNGPQGRGILRSIHNIESHVVRRVRKNGFRQQELERLLVVLGWIRPPRITNEPIDSDNQFRRRLGELYLDGHAESLIFGNCVQDMYPDGVVLTQDDTDAN